MCEMWKIIQDSARGGDMKSLHFCTPHLVKQIQENSEIIETIRTGWVPGCFPTETVKANWRRYEEEWNYKTKSHDEFLRDIIIISVQTIHFRDLDKEKHKEEIARYHRKFHPMKWFFIIQFTPRVK